MNGEIRGRKKTMRGIKNNRRHNPNRFSIFHNYIRPNQSLDGKTSAEACGITIQGENKWKTLIGNTSMGKGFLMNERA